MSNVSKYENHPSTLLRAAYVLVGLSWEQSENFEFLQKLATQCEEAFQQSVQPTPESGRKLPAKKSNRKGSAPAKSA